MIVRRRWSPRKRRRRKSAALMRAPPVSDSQATAVISKRRKLVAWLTLLCWFLHGPAGVYAATNSATGGINGINNGTLIGGDGTGTAQIEINSVQLALVKEARDLAGTVLPDGANVAPTQEVYFVLYADNITDFLAYRFMIEDAIDETQFTYSIMKREILQARCCLLVRMSHRPRKSTSFSTSTILRISSPIAS